MMDPGKYRPGYFPVGAGCLDWASRERIGAAPVWCSVDLRDGNQSLVVPMNLEEKLEFWNVLLRIGFREIEIGFPAASETEREFVRTLAGRDMIPDGVSVQVLTPCREQIIRRTFDALRGIPSAIVHFYNPLSAVQREQVFGMTRREVMKIAVDAARLIRDLAGGNGGRIRFEYSPESFTGTEPEYALEVCNAVLDVLEPGPDNNVIVNLPVTVEMSLPHVFASQVEFVGKNLDFRDNVTLSVHPHNDRGTGVADAELALLAGAQRVEGTLFGNGERAGNVDIVTLALNMYSHGVDPGLDFSDMDGIVAEYEKCTGMRVGERAPYSGALAFTAFSGSHQDAIAKGMRHRVRNKLREWTVPYIPIDPRDIGRRYDADIIRVNSQSGKGGIGYVMEHSYGYELPAGMREDMSYACKGVSDRTRRELRPDEIFAIFRERYLNLAGPIEIAGFDTVRGGDIVGIRIRFRRGGAETEVHAEGNGPLSAVSNALSDFTGERFVLQEFTQHSMQGAGSRSVAASYIGLVREGSGKIHWGAGTDTDVVKASTKALLGAFFNMTGQAGNRGEAPTRA